MTTLDFSPLFRSMIGFDRLASSLETAYRTEPGGYPPYNVEVQDENRYRITLAVAGFTEGELDIEAKENLLTVTGQRRAMEAEGNFLYRGIANRSFERKFQLADYVKVVEAKLENGLLHVDLVREVPEAMKPRRIEIHGGATSPAIEHDAVPLEPAKAA
ncbi:Hsp20 family protein [Thiocystis violacea]|uniref:Hsp20 family protein n=1 Tax=Thiocystis violacea TaxID=13725 RepID=UPI0019083BE8|nr:Hsp20 family protein [Thiocystis violacea]MBK1717788.1 heat-shock protein [Thiocystis violacea]